MKNISFKLSKLLGTVKSKFKKIRFSPIRSIKIKYRLIGSFFLISLVPFIIIGILSYSKSKNAIESKISTYSGIVIKDMGRTVNMNRVAVEDFSYDLMFSDLIQESIANIDKLDSFDKSKVYQQFDKRILTQTTKMQAMFEVGIYLNNGEEHVYNCGGDSTRIVDIDQYKDEVIKKDELSVWNIGKCTGGDSALVMCRSIKNRRADAIGSLVIGIKPAYFADIFKEATEDLGNGSELFILNAEGKVLAANSQTLHVGSGYPQKDMIKKLILR